MSSGVHGHGRGRRLLAAALFGLVVAEVATAVLSSGLAGFAAADAIDGFVVTNIAIGLSCGLAGVLIAWHRPGNALGWLLLAAAVCQSTTAALYPMGVLGAQRGWPEPALRTLITGADYAWPWSIALFLPLALLVFPDGLPPGRFWRAVTWFTVLSSPVFVLEAGADPRGLSLDGGAVSPWLLVPDYSRLAPLWTFAEISEIAVLLVAMAGLVVRYRRGDESRRRQLLWLVLALVIMILVLIPWGLFQAGPILQLLAIALVPAAMTIAVLRHQLLDIRLVLSRTLLYGLLTAGVIGTYLGLVAVADTVLHQNVGLGNPLLATLVIALVFNPVRVRLQRIVDRAVYGDRADPVRAVSRMGERMASGTEADSGDVLAAVREALRLPYTALKSGGVQRAADGAAPELLETIALIYRGEQVGELIVGVRSGQRRLSTADRAVLELLAAPLAVAVHATTLSEDVQHSREQIVAAREEERRRLRRDLHDSLGPVLTGIGFQADAASNLLRAEPERAAELLAQLRTATSDAIADVRRLVYALRPPALDELGLVGALRRQAEALDGNGLSMAVEAPGHLPVLSAAVEVAAYRIGVEALTNAARHAGASHVDLWLAVSNGGEPGLEIAVTDDGAASGQEWIPGVGLTSIRERVEELGGSCSIGPAVGVKARFPL